MGMRRGCSDYVLFNSDGNKIEGNSRRKPIAVSLGWDFCAEHEWGISDLYDLFGVDSKKIGLERRVVGNFDKKALLFVANDDYVFLVGSKPYIPLMRDGEVNPKTLTKLAKGRSYPFGYDGLLIRENETFGGAWDDGSFGILALAKSPAGKFVNDLHNAFHAGDAAIFFGGSSAPIGNAGLVLAIASKLPKEVVKTMREADLDAKKLKEAAKKVEQETGLKDRLREAGKSWFALSPKWANEINSTKNGKIKTDHPVIYWLNPEQQQANNFGWYTVEDLLLWAENKGPIPKES